MGIDKNVKAMFKSNGGLDFCFYALKSEHLCSFISEKVCVTCIYLLFTFNLSNSN